MPLLPTIASSYVELDDDDFARPPPPAAKPEKGEACPCCCCCCCSAREGDGGESAAAPKLPGVSDSPRELNNPVPYRDEPSWLKKLAEEALSEVAVVGAGGVSISTTAALFLVLAAHSEYLS